MGKINAIFKKSGEEPEPGSIEPQPFEDSSVEQSHTHEAHHVSINGSNGQGMMHHTSGGPRTLTREQLKLRSALLHANQKYGIQSTLITSLSEGAGVTSMSTALAQGISWDQQKQVLLIDANFNRPQLQNVFGIDKPDGLAKGLEDGDNLLDYAVAVEPSNLMVLPMGEPYGRSHFDIKRFTAALQLFRENFDYVVIDAPPISRYPEVLMMSSYIDSVALVVEAEQTRVPELRVIIDELNRAQARLLGVILNRERNHLPEAIRHIL